MFKCDECDYECKRKNSIISHKKHRHSDIKEFKCDECDYECKSKHLLKNHKKHRHSDIKEFKCDECDYECKIKSDLYKHKIIHSDIKEFKCDECEYEGKSKRLLKSHINNIHCIFKCDECEYEGNNKIVFQRHLKIHNLKCDECEYEGKSTQHLKSHINNIHNDIKKFKCIYDKCEYKCKNKSDLNRHIKKCDGKKSNKSSGEKQIEKILITNNIKYKYNTTYMVKNENLLKWDFILFINDDICFIEYNGRQHYEYVQFNGISKERAMEKLYLQKKRDRIKNAFCKKNNYNILWIPYWEYDNINTLVNEFIKLKWQFK